MPAASFYQPYKHLLAVIILMLNWSLALHAQTTPVQKNIDKIVKRCYPGTLVYVNTADTNYTIASGWNKKGIKKTESNDLFKIGSVSKLYIAAATAKLINAGKLDLNQTLTQFIPELSGHIQNAEQITLEMLLKHRSGIPEYLYHPDFAGSNPHVDYMTTIALIYDAPAEFSPNKRYQYCNSNYLLLGEILDRTLGYSHHTYIKTEILIPLKLKHTYNLASEADLNKIMSGYNFKGDIDYKLREEHTRPGGSMVATAENVGIFLRALINGSLFTEEEQKIYTQIYRYGHTGWLNGYCCIARYHPRIDAVIVQFVNTSRGKFFWLRLNRNYKHIVKAIEQNKAY